MDIGFYIFLILVVIILIILISNVKIVPQAHSYVVERLGTYRASW
ncbi:MAG TPA: peptidase, partial [Ruminococcaceae bacterium]|nr:peptidase [Oscillospiraceae bacterium]